MTYSIKVTNADRQNAAWGSTTVTLDEKLASQYSDKVQQLALEMKKKAVINGKTYEDSYYLQIAQASIKETTCKLNSTYYKNLLPNSAVPDSEWSDYTWEEIINMNANGVYIPKDVLLWAYAFQSTDEISYVMINPDITSQDTAPDETKLSNLMSETIKDTKSLDKIEKQVNDNTEVIEQNELYEKEINETAQKDIEKQIDDINKIISDMDKLNTKDNNTISQEDINTYHNLSNKLNQNKSLLKIKITNATKNTNNTSESTNSAELQNYNELTDKAQKSSNELTKYAKNYNADRLKSGMADRDIIKYTPLGETAQDVGQEELPTIVSKKLSKTNFALDELQYNNPQLLNAHSGPKNAQKLVANASVDEKSTKNITNTKDTKIKDNITSDNNNTKDTQIGTTTQKTQTPNINIKEEKTVSNINLQQNTQSKTSIKNNKELIETNNKKNTINTNSIIDKTQNLQEITEDNNEKLNELSLIIEEENNKNTEPVSINETNNKNRQDITNSQKFSISEIEESQKEYDSTTNENRNLNKTKNNFAEQALNDIKEVKNETEVVQKDINEVEDKKATQNTTTQNPKTNKSQKVANSTLSKENSATQNGINPFANINNRTSNITNEETAEETPKVEENNNNQNILVSSIKNSTEQTSPNPFLDINNIKQSKQKQADDNKKNEAQNNEQVETNKKQAIVNKVSDLTNAQSATGSISVSNEQKTDDKEDRKLSRYNNDTEAETRKKNKKVKAVNAIYTGKKS